MHGTGASPPILWLLMVAIPWLGAGTIEFWFFSFLHDFLQNDDEDIICPPPSSKRRRIMDDDVRLAVFIPTYIFISICLHQTTTMVIVTVHKYLYIYNIENSTFTLPFGLHF